MIETQLDIFGRTSTQEAGFGVVNISSVPQRSPFRYPGGKTWLIPIVRNWLSRLDSTNITLVEPFAGGGIVSLTAGFESLASQIIMVEKDAEVAAVWQTIFSDENEWLANKIFDFDLTHENAKAHIEIENKTVRELAFSTILKNRLFHGGIIAKGSGFLKRGESGKGIGSRWYPKTLKTRICDIQYIRNKIQFIEGDAFEIIEESKNFENFCFFIDPPYYKAAKRLYTHFEVDHDRLFKLASEICGHFLMTYDDTEEIRELAFKYGLDFKKIPMKTTHHVKKYELLISNDLFTTE